MKNKLPFCALFALLFALASPARLYAQMPEPEPQVPSLLNQAGHCLVSSTQDWLGLTKNPAELGHFAWVVDRKSSPGERHMYLLARLDTGAAELFDIKMETRHGKHILTMENRLEVAAADIQTGQDHLVSVPAGGPRLEKLYTNTLLKLQRKGTYDVQLNKLRQPVSNLICDSETAE